MLQFFFAADSMIAFLVPLAQFHCQLDICDLACIDTCKR